MSERPTFSPVWHRVRATAPRLRPHVQITRQRYRGRRWHVVHDPSSNQFYRLNPIAHEFVCSLDGKRSVEQAWNQILLRHGDAAPTQPEVIELISQLFNANLLAVDASPEAEQLLSRGRERTLKRVQQQAIGLMYFRIRLFNPDLLLSWIEPVFRPLINRVGFALWCLWVLSALVGVAVDQWSTLAGGFDAAIAPSNWPWLIVVFIVTKAVHETGHGVICKRFGGQVPEFGAMMLVLFPAPYVDASACWAFPSKWQRMAVGAGGMMFELTLAAGAAWVWKLTHVAGADQPLAAQLCYNAMFTASVSTVVFNANPLMRFDGYYILSDLLEIPNLMSRSFGHLKYVFQKHVYRAREARAVSSSNAERAILVAYGLLALAYRVFLFFSITLYIMGKLFAIGLVLAVWTAAVWFILPVAKFVQWHASSSLLGEHRVRAACTSLALILLGAALLGAVPFPDHRRASGVVESLTRTGVFVRTDGFVTEARARPGQRVEAGQVLLVAQSPQLDADIKSTHADLNQIRSIERQMTATNPAGAQVARDRITTLEERLASLERKRGDLVVTAPHAGVVVSGDPAAMIGAYATQGAGVCEIIDTERLRVAASMPQAESSWLFELKPEQYSVQMRRVSRAEHALRGSRVEPIPAGQRLLPHASLGFAGGGAAEVDPSDQQGLVAKRPRFTTYVYADEPVGVPGERVRLRFTLPAKPLAAQWADRLHKLIQGRIDI